MMRSTLLLLASFQLAIVPLISATPSPSQPARRSEPTVVRTYKNWHNYGCYADPDGGKALTVPMPVNGGSIYTTIELCADACQAASYNLAGVEDGYECACDNNTVNGNTVNPGVCMEATCQGDSTELCGALSSFLVYRLYELEN